MSYSAAALIAVAAIVESLLGGPAPSLSAEVFDELDAAGDLDAWHELELDAREAEGDDHDWTDPDTFDAETVDWYDRHADPHAWSDGDSDDGGCRFYLGTHRPHWLYAAGSRESKPAGPLFVSIRQIRHARRSAWPVCDTAFSIDSGGFTELRQNGGWATSPEQYAAEVAELEERTRCLRWAAIQDWMVEDDALARTGLTIAEHQARTVASFLRLRELAPQVRWLPVLQGQTREDYVAHLEMYAAAGVHLASMGCVGVGSVCRRQASEEIAEILAELARRGLRLHGFGVKSGGLQRAAEFLASADSLAWSLGARKRAPGAQNSQAVAEAWRSEILKVPGVRS